MTLVKTVFCVFFSETDVFCLSCNECLWFTNTSLTRFFLNSKHKYYGSLVPSLIDPSVQSHFKTTLSFGIMPKILH